MQRIGLCFGSGSGVSKDDTEAAKWFELAVAQEDPAAMSELANCYLRGIGVAADAERGIQLHVQAAAEHKHSPSMVALR